MRFRARLIASSIAVLALVVTACGTGTQSSSSAEASAPPASVSASDSQAPQSAAPSEAATACDITVDEPVSVGFASATQPAYSPALLAIQESEDIPMEPTFFQQSELAMQALLQGEVDVLAIGVNGPMITISEGADLRIFGVTIGNDWTVVATQEIQSPADLAGKTIAIHSETSTGTPLLHGTLDDAGVEATLVTIPGSPNRAQAMTQGQVDATPLFLSDSIRLERSDPDRFHVLLDYGDVPFASQALVAGTEWLDADPQLAECVLSQFVATAQRMSDEPDWTLEQVTALFPEEDPEYLDALVTEYIDRGLWVTDGGSELLANFSDAVQINIDLGTLAADASTDPADYLRTDLLDAVLAGG